jgi:HlyD family secretion protein
MDIARPSSVARNKKIKRVIYVVIILIAAAGVTLGLSRMKPAAPTVDGATLWRDTVKRGQMVVNVRGLGTLVPDEVRMIPTSRDGTVEEKLVKIGDTVTPNTVLVVLSNPDLVQQVANQELAYQKALADLANTRAQLETQILNQRSTQASKENQALQARLQAETDEQLFKEGLGPELNLKKSKANADALANEVLLEKQRVDTLAKSNQAQIAAAEAGVQQLKAIWELGKKQLEELKVRAGAAGVLQQLNVELGQKLAPGASVAKVANPGKLRAELKIAETQVKDIAIGQVAQIDTRNGIIDGHVIRIDPAAVNGTVTVDVSLEGELPRGARPDLSVDGTVEISKLDDVLQVGRPAYGQQDSTITLFKMTPAGEAIRTQVRLGKSAVNVIQIMDGLNVGDVVILSDMSTWDAVDRVRVIN